jgi:hypothetical protein
VGRALINDRWRERLSKPSVVLWSVIAGLVVYTPSLAHGFLFDDYWARIYLLRRGPHAGVALAWWNLFTFFDDNPVRRRMFEREGMLQWWSDPEIRISFLRPVSAATHWFDSLLWPDSPAVHHAHSLLWYAAVVALTALLYRRIFASAWLAGFAALIFAVDHTHGVVAAWISNRNASIAGAFGLAALLLHDQGVRRRGFAQVLAPVALAASLFAGESGVASIGYLGAYAIAFDDRPPGTRARSLIPALIAALVWLAVYRLGHYGAFGSGLYLDPLRAPGTFVRAFPAHFVLLYAAEFAPGAPELWMFLQGPAAAIMVLLGATVLTIVFVALWPRLRTDRTTRFLALGSIFATLPSCATSPHTRLLLLPSVGMIGLVAVLVDEALDRAFVAAQPSPTRRAIRFAAIVAGGMHVFLSPVVAQFTQRQMVTLQRYIDRLAASIPDEPSLPSQTLILANEPDGIFTTYVIVRREFLGQTNPARFVPLAIGTHPNQLERTGTNTLELFAPDGVYRNGTDLLFRSLTRPMHVGDRAERGGVDVEVLACNAQGVPTRARFTFERPLEDASFRWMKWEHDRFVPFRVPAVGERVAIAPAVPQMF